MAESRVFETHTRFSSDAVRLAGDSRTYLVYSPGYVWHSRLDSNQICRIRSRATVHQREYGSLGGSRTHTLRGLNPPPLPVGIQDHGAYRRIRTFTERCLKPLSLPVGLYRRGATRWNRTIVSGFAIRRMSHSAICNMVHLSGIEPNCHLSS